MSGRRSKPIYFNLEVIDMIIALCLKLHYLQHNLEYYVRITTVP